MLRIRFMGMLVVTFCVMEGFWCWRMVAQKWLTECFIDLLTDCAGCTASQNTRSYT